MLIEPSPSSLKRILIALCTVAALTACTPPGSEPDPAVGQGEGGGPQGSSSTDEFLSGSGSGGDCFSSEEGITNCPGDEGEETDDPTDEVDAGFVDDGTDAGCPDIDDNGGGDCPEDGCPPVPGLDAGAGGGDCPEDGCPPVPGLDAGAGGGDAGAEGDDASAEGSDAGSDSFDAGGDPPQDGGEVANTPDANMSPAASCFEDEFTPEGGLAADLLLVVDRSLSMTEAAPGSTEDKWVEMTGVISDVVWELDQELGFGLSTFPGPVVGDLQCGEGSVVVDIDDSTAPDISFALLITQPNGGTPTAPTLRMARNYLSNRVTDRPQAVVLATDGAPNCNTGLNPAACVCSQASCGGEEPRACLDDAQAVAATEELAQAGFATFVVGIPGSELFALVLDRMAEAGGTAQQGSHRYYPTTSAAELESALRDIGQRVTECRFELSQEPQADTIIVTVDGAQVARDNFRLNGWDYVGANTIEFFGPACDNLAGGGSVIGVEYCEPPPS